MPDIRETCSICYEKINFDLPICYCSFCDAPMHADDCAVYCEVCKDSTPMCEDCRQDDGVRYEDEPGGTEVFLCKKHRDE
jgi:hypothetical protein